MTDYGDENPLLMDYYGFDPEMYELTFKSRGDSALSELVVNTFKEVRVEMSRAISPSNHYHIQTPRRAARHVLLRNQSPVEGTDVVTPVIIVQSPAYEFGPSQGTDFWIIQGQGWTMECSYLSGSCSGMNTWINQ